MLYVLCFIAGGFFGVATMCLCIVADEFEDYEVYDEEE